jgi:hypothetical protein
MLIIMKNSSQNKECNLTIFNEQYRQPRTKTDKTKIIAFQGTSFYFI